MKAITITALVILCVVALACSKPASSPQLQQDDSHPLSPENENTRKAWNNAKQVMKRLTRRVRRQAPRQPNVEINLDFANISGQLYILDLYKNLTNSTIAPESTQANTIRSLLYLNNVVDCGVFNFSLAAMNKSEYVLRAELHLWAEGSPIDPVQNYMVKITATSANGNEIYTTEEVQFTRDGYHIFNVEQLTRALIEEDERYANLSIKVYKTVSEYRADRPRPCIMFKFKNQDYNDKTTPIFIVYTYNQNIENINYKQIAENTISKMQQTLTNNVEPVGQRKKRQLTNYCQVNEFIINGSSIFSGMVGSTAPDFNVIHPSDYNAGICGGYCSTSQFPDRSPTNHAHFMHVLLEQKKQVFRDRHNYNFQRCCAPVKYAPLSVFTFSYGSVNINTIKNLLVEECECLDIIV